MKVTIVKDLYREVAEEFKTEWWLVALYVISMAALAFHLFHGFSSAFQTLGLNHKKYNGLINIIGIGVFAILLPIGFAAMPLYFFIK
jgi:succinate dehydrogenase / fumarate reductase cytochrome b subunit